MCFMSFFFNFEGVLLVMRGCACVLRGCSRALKTPNSPPLISTQIDEIQDTGLEMGQPWISCKVTWFSTKILAVIRLFSNEF